MRAHMLKVVAVLAATAAGCGPGEVSAPQSAPDMDPNCEQMAAKLHECFPETDGAATCTPEGLAQFRTLGLADRPCDDIGANVKADSINFAGCGPDEHECALVMCCPRYRLHWTPSKADWDSFLPLVTAFQSATPGDKRAAIDNASVAAQHKGVSISFIQDVATTQQGSKKEMAVEISRLLVDVPFDRFRVLLPAERWGGKLAQYLGGEVRVVEKNSARRAVRQVERMVLSPFHTSFESSLTNQDMTKVESIVYEPSRSVVYWRVLFSDNGSTEEDLGSVEFKASGRNATVVTFHSAHRLNMAGSIHIDNELVTGSLSDLFLAHLRHYRDLLQPR